MSPKSEKPNNFVSNIWTEVVRLLTHHMSTPTQNQLEKLYLKYERLNLNDPFQQMDARYLENLTPSARSVSPKSSRSSKSKSSLGSSSASRKELVKAELLGDQEKVKAERKLQKLKLLEKQVRLQQEL